MKTLKKIQLAIVLGGALNICILAIPPARILPYQPIRWERGIQEPSNVEADELLRQVLVHYNQGNFDKGLALCTKAARLSPKDYRPHVLAGYIHVAQMKLKSASEAFARAIELNPQHSNLYVVKARADIWRGAIDEALATCRKAIELDPNFAEGYIMMGEALRHDEKRRQEAIAAYQSSLKINPQLLSVYEPLGSLLEELNDKKGAEDIFRRGMAADPKGMTARFALGRLLVKQDRLTEAREVWAGRTSDEDQTYPNFITLLERAEQMKQAKDALAQRPNDPAALVGMGLAVMDGDSWVIDRRQERAVEYFRQALKIKPDYAPAQFAICKAYIQLADTFEDMKKMVNKELAKMRQLDPALARELEEYRKTYSGGIVGSPPVKFNK